VVLSASRLLQPLNEAPVAVTVIDQEMIRASGFRDIPDLLRLVPGFSVAYTQFNTWTGAYHGLGDGYFRRFQVRVDGRSIYSPHNGAVLWSDLPLSIDDIERIEVVRGPDAAVYGANAFSGVINIITKTAAQVPGGFVSMQAGNKDMRGLTARYGGGDETAALPAHRLGAAARPLRARHRRGPILRGEPDLFRQWPPRLAAGAGCGPHGPVRTVAGELGQRQQGQPGILAGAD
jgi:outer membrane receptor protein involved in Fe transport